MNLDTLQFALLTFGFVFGPIGILMTAYCFAEEAYYTIRIALDK